MRAVLVVATVAIFGFSGCGDDTTAVTADLATAAGGDMSAAATDLSMLSCANILSCVAGCGQNLVCQVTCRDSGTTQSKGVFDAFAGCVALTCASGDGGSGACTSATDSQPPCLSCLANSATAAVGPSGACHTEYAACAGS